MTLYIFDVDGTLTEPAQRMDEGFAAYFARWAHDKRYFLTSGSTLETMRRQIPPDILSQAEGWFPCAGGGFWRDGRLESRRAAAWPPSLAGFIGRLLITSEYENKFMCGLPVEDRGTMVCVSVIGRGRNDAAERARYVEWDRATGEREKLADAIREAYPDLSVTLGGQTSIDIAPKGMDKGQIFPAVREFSSLPIVFFADKAHEGGNDYPLAEALRAESTVLNAVMHVTCPRDTRAMLETMEAHDCRC